MRKLLIGLALSVIATASHAEWIEIAQSVNGDTYYVDPATKRRKGNIVRMWSFVAFAVPSLSWDNKPYRSEKMHLAFNCDDDTHQIIYIAGFTDSRGLSPILFTMDTPDPPGKWRAIVPDSTLATRHRFACDR
jgi:hypothetical protein